MNTEDIKTKRKTGMEDVFLGQKIKEARLNRSVGLTDLGKRIGVTAQQIQKYENGKNRISALRLRDIARVLDVRICTFLGEEE